LGARIVSAILGVLAVAFVFDGVRRAVNLRAAWFAAVLLAVILWLLVRLWENPRPFHAVLLGLVAAIGMQTWLSALVIGPLFLLTASLLWLSSTREYRRALVLSAIVFALAAGLYLAHYVQFHGLASGRTQSLFLLTPTRLEIYKQLLGTDSSLVVIAKQLWTGLSAFHLGRGIEATYAVPFPMADRFTALLMLPGVIVMVLRSPAVLSVPTLVFTLGQVLVGIGLFPPTGYNRVVGALALATIPAALAVTLPLDRITQGRRWLRIVADGVIVALAAGITFTNAELYLLRYPSSITRFDSNTEAAWTALEYATTHRTHLVSWTARGNEGMVLSLGAAPVMMRTTTSSADYLMSVEATGRDLFILHPADAEGRAALRERFPAVRLQMQYRETNGEPMIELGFVD
jgi:hypothetical protein